MPKIVDHDERRREIIDVTKNIILHGGFEAATMRSIASAAGFANGALKHYFPSKESIVASVFEGVLAEMSSTLNSASDDSSVVGIRAYLEAILPLDEERITAGRVLLALWEYSMSDEGLAESYRAHLRSWRAVLIGKLAAARAAGEITIETSDEQLAAELISVTVGSNVLSLLFPMGELIDVYRSYVDAFIERL